MGSKGTVELALDTEVEYSLIFGEMLKYFSGTVIVIYVVRMNNKRA